MTTTAIRTNEVLAVVNAQASGIPRPDRLGAELERAIADAGGEPEVRITRSLDDLVDVVGRAEGRRVALAGGDGVLHAIANLGFGELPELALIPAGRANNIARALGIPADPVAAARLAVNGEARPLDTIAVTTPAGTVHAVEGVSAGFQAAARARYDAPNSGAVVAGALALVRTLARLPHFTTRVRFDDGPERRLDFEQLFLSSLPYFSFGLRVDPGADPRDGVDEAIVLHASSRHEALAELLDIRRGRHLQRSDTEIAPWRRIELLDPVPLAADGEPLGPTTASLAVEPAALHVVTGAGDVR